MTVNCNRHMAMDRLGTDNPLPPNWPHRTQSAFVPIGRLTWHLQVHASRKPSDRTIVLLHGTGASTHSWADLIGVLQEGACVLAIDLPGHGFTRGADPKNLTLPMMARDLHELFLEIELEKNVILVGHSAGAPLAIELAYQHSALNNPAFQITQIIGLNPSLVPPPALYTTLLGPMVAPMATSGPMTSMIAFIASSTAMVNQLLDSTESKISDQHRDYYRFLFSQPSHVQGSMGFMAGADLPSILTRAKGLTIPISFLIGQRDSWVKENALKKIIQEYFPRAQITIWPGGHLLHEEQPLAAAKYIQTIVLTNRETSAAPAYGRGK